MAEIQQLPNGQWIIAGDTAHGRAALEMGHIKTETSIYGLREVEALKPGDVVLDIGAFVGDTARHFLDIGCVVHAFEPFPDTCACLRANCPEATIYNDAVGNGGMVALLDAFDQTYPHHQGNHGTRGVVETNGTQRTLAIDDLELLRVDLVKLDVEGYEISALKGMRKTLKRCRPIIVVEVFDSMLAKFGFTPADIKKFIPHGYRQRVCVGRDEDDRRDWAFWPKEKFPHW